MKRFFSLLFIVVITASVFLPRFNANAARIQNESIEYFADGSYGVTILSPATDEQTKGSVTKTKAYQYYDNNNVLQWTVKLTASFTYNGVTATCNSATTAFNNNNSAWHITKADASYSGSTATGDFTVKKYFAGIPIKTVNKTLTLTCTPGGTVY